VRSLSVRQVKERGRSHGCSLLRRTDEQPSSRGPRAAARCVLGGTKDWYARTMVRGTTDRPDEIRDRQLTVL
jgi:hypothetical protein